MFCYLTGFRASEVRPFLKTGLSAEGVKVLGAKRKKGETPVTRSGWGSSWQDAMNAWIRSADPTIKENDLVTGHHLYFALQDVRSVAITSKLDGRAADTYDFAAHANPATAHKNYDRRRVKIASATE